MSIVNSPKSWGNPFAKTNPTLAQEKLAADLWLTYWEGHPPRQLENETSFIRDGFMRIAAKVLERRL